MDTKEKKPGSGTRHPRTRKTAGDTGTARSASGTGGTARRTASDPGTARKTDRTGGTARSAARKRDASTRETPKKRTAAAATRRRTRTTPTKPQTPAPDVVYVPAKPFSRERFLLRLATVVAVVVAMMFGISIFFRVEHVTVSGTEKYTPYMIQQAAGIKEGDALLGLSDARISGKITSALPYVENVRIAIQLPDTVNIEITELDVAYAIRDEKDAWWLITADGRIVTNADSATAGSYTKIEGVRLEDPVSGEQAKAADVSTGVLVEDPVSGAMVPQTESGSTRLAAALSILQYLEDNVIIGEVASVNVENLSALELWYGQRFQVKLGDTTELGYKIACMNAAINGADGLGDHDSGVLDISFTVYPDKIGYSVFP